MAHVKAKSSNHKVANNSTSTVSATTSTSSRAASSVRAARKIISDMKALPVIGSAVAEFIGTFLLVLLFLSYTVGGSQIMVSFALIGIVLLVGGVSGAHLNPAITIGAWVTRKIDAVRTFGYIIAQTLGATAAITLLNSFLASTTPSSAELAGQTAPKLLQAATLVVGKEPMIFYSELIGVAILAFGVATALRFRRDRISAAVTQGFAILIALTVTSSLLYLIVSQQGTSLTFLNPLIAAVSNAFSTVYLVTDGKSTWNMWPIAIYVIAPIVGSIIGFILQDFLQSQSSDNSCESCDNCNCCK